MDYPMPPLCAECGQAVPPHANPIITRQAFAEAEDGEMQPVSPMLVVHQECVAAFDAKHPSQAEAVLASAPVA